MEYCPKCGSIMVNDTCSNFDCAIGSSTITNSTESEAYAKLDQYAMQILGEPYAIASGNGTTWFKDPREKIRAIIKTVINYNGL